MVLKRKQHVLRKKPRLPPRPPVADASRFNPLRAYQSAFLEWTLTTGLAAQTARIRAQALDQFIRWCDERGLNRPQDVTRPILQRYQRYLYHYRKVNGQPLTFATQATRLHPLVAFFKWLARENHILYNPASDLELPKQPHQLPKHLLSVAQVESIINQPDVETPMGLRGRAILETLYSSGIRRAELTQLKLYDVDLERGSLMVRAGKGGKDRLVPLGERACAWIRKYLADVRPLLVAEPDCGYLFITDYGEAFEKNRLSDMVKKYVRNAGFMSGSCHLFRHAMATHMLDNGADIRYIQAILGHSELTTTQIYTQVSITKLKQIHAATHPAKLERTNITTVTSATPASADAQTLLATLAAEANDDEHDVR